jgi:hypothetical protein
MKMNYIPLPEPPPGWGSDGLSKFINIASANTYATFHNLKAEYTKLSEIDVVFQEGISNLSNLPNTLGSFAAFFFPQAHLSFLGAVRLVLSGQSSETYACLRLTLENVLYGFYISKNPSSAETWLNRQTSAAAKQKVREEFKIAKLLGELKTSDSKEGCVAEALYSETIDLGAHPNELALIQRLNMVEGDGKTEFPLTQLQRGDSPASLLALQRSAQVGVSALGVFRLVYPERFDILGLTDKLHHLRKGL